METIQIGSRWRNKRNGGHVTVREVNSQRNSIRLQEPSSCYTERLTDFLRDFVRVETLYQVFTRGDLHLVIPDSECSFETLKNIEDAGFILRWDSAPTSYKGAQYAAEHYQAFIAVDRCEFDAKAVTP